MIPTFKKKYGEGDNEIRIGWASWDDGSFQDRSIKYVYYDSSGKISRGCPELSFEVLVDLVVTAIEQGELDQDSIEFIKATINKI